MDEADLKARRAASFGAVARAYAEHRPHYPDAAIAWVLEPVQDRPIVRVLDLGAGTGRVSEALLRADVNVIAVEPDSAMRAVMLERVPGVAVLAGAAEDIPLPDQRVDAVVAGQAFHWFDHEPARLEIARVLKPGGVLAAMWNTEDVRVPWVAEYGKRSDFTSASDRVVLEPGMSLADHPAFEPEEWATFEHSFRRTADSLVATVATYSAALVLPEAERAERLDAIRDYLGSRPETAVGEFDLPMVTKVARSIRR